MLKTIIPVAVACELKGKAEAAASGAGGCPVDHEGQTVRRDGATCMFQGQTLQSSADDDPVALRCQSLLNTHNQSGQQIRPPSKV